MSMPILFFPLALILFTVVDILLSLVSHLTSHKYFYGPHPTLELILNYVVFLYILNLVFIATVVQSFFCSVCQKDRVASDANHRRSKRRPVGTI
jgi:hypothetical protein